MAVTGGDKKEVQAEGEAEKIMEKELTSAPKGVPPAQMASADADKGGKEIPVEVEAEEIVEAQPQVPSEEGKENIEEAEE